MMSGLKSVQNLRDVVPPAIGVGSDLGVGHDSEDGAFIRHHIAHAGYGEGQLAAVEDEGVYAVGAEASNRCLGVVSRDAHHHTLVPTGYGGVPNEGVESDAAAGQSRSLGEAVEDSH